MVPDLQIVPQRLPHASAEVDLEAARGLGCIALEAGIGLRSSKGAQQSADMHPVMLSIASIAWQPWCMRQGAGIDDGNRLCK